MNHSLLVGALFFGVMLGSCSTSNDVVQNGPLQKRKYRNGWQLDLRTGSGAKGNVEDRASSDRMARNRADIRFDNVAPTTHQQAPATDTPAMPPDSWDVTKWVPEPFVEGVARSGQEVYASAGPGIDLTQVMASEQVRVEQPHQATVPSSAPDGDGERTNGMAIAGFVSAFFIPVLGIVLSAIALGQIRRNGGRGRGLAKAGLWIGIGTMILLILLL